MHWDHEKITKEEWNWNGTKKIKLKPKQPIKKKEKGFSEKEINVDKQELTSLGCRRDLERDSNWFGL